MHDHQPTRRQQWAARRARQRELYAANRALQDHAERARRGEFRRPTPAATSHDRPTRQPNPTRIESRPTRQRPDLFVVPAPGYYHHRRPDPMWRSVLLALVAFIEFVAVAAWHCVKLAVLAFAVLAAAGLALYLLTLVGQVAP